MAAVAGRLQRPTRSIGRAALLAPAQELSIATVPFWPCSGWVYLATRSRRVLVVSTPPFSPYPTEVGRFVSVALSRGSPPGCR